LLIREIDDGAHDADIIYRNEERGNMIYAFCTPAACGRRRACM
jgi:hypothetical protein